MSWPTCAPNPHLLKLTPTQCFVPPSGYPCPLKHQAGKPPLSCCRKLSLMQLRMPIKHLIILPQTGSHIQSLPPAFDCSFISWSSQNVKLMAPRKQSSPHSGGCQVRCWDPSCTFLGLTPLVQLGNYSLCSSSSVKRGG